jgi:DNA-binding XRE family transcriptional regulator
MNSKSRGRGAPVAPVESSVEGSASEHSTATGTGPKAVGARIAEARGRRTQAQFAELLGVAEGTLGRYERGERLPDSEFVIAMVERANISSHWLLLHSALRRAREGWQRLDRRGRAHG